MKEKSIKKRVAEISTGYFDYMASSFPVISLSDEFYFFPRAEKGVLYLNRLDSLDADKIKDDICYIKSLKRVLLRLDGKKVELETRIDIRLLSQSMNIFLREFDDVSI